MSLKKQAGVILIACLLCSGLSLIHTNALGIAIDWDDRVGMFILGGISFLTNLFLVSNNKKVWFFYLIFSPLILTFCFSFMELLSEVNPQNISKGFGIVYFVLCYFVSIIGTIVALLSSWLFLKLK